MSIHDPKDFVTKCVNLAQPRLGAQAIHASDDFFAPKERMLNAEPAVFVPGKYDDHGKWMDGWETRRKRVAGHDWCIVQLGLAGVIKGVDIDTSHFTGNYPPAASLDACRSEADPNEKTVWTTLIPATNLKGNSHHYIEVRSDQTWTHVRLNIYPDGGVARLRVYGQVTCDWAQRDRGKTYDLAALESGGRIVGCNDSHFGAPENMLAPGRGVNMGDSWETRRRREPGHDWAIIALGAPGTIVEALIDTAHHKGNYPDRCSLQAASVKGLTDESLITQSMFWDELLPPQKLQADAIHSFKGELQAFGPITHARVNIFPDGGISRLRLFGLLE
jgi:allantoicase